jgi:hypothetical protein
MSRACGVALEQTAYRNATKRNFLPEITVIVNSNNSTKAKINRNFLQKERSNNHKQLL